MVLTSVCTTFFAPRALLSKAIFPSSLPLPMPQMPRALAKHTRQTVDTSVLDQVVKRGERKEDFGFLQKTSGVRRNIVR